MSAIGSCLAGGDILLDLRVTSTAQLFEAVGEHMQAAHGLPADAVAASLMRREAAGSTALGQGVAIPHARVKELDRIRMLYARLSPAVPFDPAGGEPVSEVVALLVPAPATQTQLDVLAHVASLFSDKRFRKTLRACDDPARIRALFAQWPV
ncbi:MAG: PTS sugar transporter subunit IIA [Candidatus Dactylopiibacterium sp.]|nr:PTS sugar transporter subunit IIA [Candidatus Dactylopiibacterium sp.]